MLLLKHGSMWLVMFLLLGVRKSNSAESPGKIKKGSGDEVRDRGGGIGKQMELKQFQADSGGYRNNSDPAPTEENEEGEPTVTEEKSPTSELEAAASKPELVTVETSTHQEEMTFGEEFESADKSEKNMEEEENTQRAETNGETFAGSTIYEVVAEDKNPQENVNLRNSQTNFPHDIRTDESSHDGYNEDSILYFESKRYKGLKKKNPTNPKIREMSNSIAETVSPNKERVHITSYVADITEVDNKATTEESKVVPLPPPRDATTISTFFIAPKESVSRRTPVRIRKKIIKPVRLGYRKKQNQQSNHFISDSQPVFRQKVTLVEPPSSRNQNSAEIEKENKKPESTTEHMSVFHEDIIDHIDIPLDDKNYLPLKPYNMVADSGPYIPPPSLAVTSSYESRTPEQYLREEITKFQIKEKLIPVLPTALVPEILDDHPHIAEPPVTPIENDGSSITFINALSQTLEQDYKPKSHPFDSVHFITSKKQKPNDYNEKLNDYDTLTDEYEKGMSADNNENSPKLNFEETNRAEDGLTSSDTILAPIQAAVSLSNHVQAEGKKKPIPNTVIEQQEIRVEPVLKTTIEIQKSIPFEIKELKPDYNQIPNFNPEYEKPVETVQRPGPYQNDFLQQVALAYHKLSNNNEYQTNLQIPPITAHQPQAQNYIYYYRNRLPQQQLYLLPFYNKGANDFSKGHVGQYIMQHSYKNLGLEQPTRPYQFQNLKYQGVFPTVSRPLTYSNLYDLSSPLLYQPNIPVINQNGFGYHKGQVQVRVPIGVEHNPNQHLGPVHGHFEQGPGGNNEEEIDAPSTEENLDTTEEIKQGSEVQVHEVKQDILQEPITELPPPPVPLQPQPQPHIQHVSEPQRIPNNQPYPYGYSFIYPITTTDFRSQSTHPNYHRRGKAPPFRPSHPMYTSQYPPHTYIVASSLPDRGIHARSINNKKLCIEYGGFKPPLVPSIQIDDEFEKEAQDKSSKDE